MNKETRTNKTQETTGPELRILKTGKCKSLSGKSDLTYHIGHDENSEIMFRVSDNSGSGYFSNEWVSMERIGKALAGSNGITSFMLHSIFSGKSFNNGGFLLAVLKQEGLVVKSKEKERPRCYQLGDPSRFMAEVQKLVNAPGDQKGVGKAKSGGATRRATSKKSTKTI
jgi:hypothetical protein